ncbi:putative methyltransferase DDB_G0268948 [Ptychodera flava]|uniref:putative methyltransferase DDB_G0268948 n=1 Tax=Ptychodera flava TaxID=63121 RepID=UPI00396A1CC1
MASCAEKLKADAFNKASISKFYSQYRPKYSNELYENIMSFLGEKLAPPYTLAVDVACGTGQGTRPLADHFPEVIGTDISPTQIAEAKVTEKFPNVTYQVAAAESLPFKPNSVDLVTVASAIHWFADLEKFYDEVDRVLRPGGCLAVYTYNHEDMQLCFEGKTERLSQIFQEFIAERYKSFWDMDSFQLIRNRFRDLRLPYGDNKRSNSLKYSDDITVAGMMGYVRSMALLKRYNDDYRESLIQEFQERIMAALDVKSTPEDTVLKREFLTFLCMARKPEV